MLWTRHLPGTERSALAFNLDSNQYQFAYLLLRALFGERLNHIWMKNAKTKNIYESGFMETNGFFNVTAKPFTHWQCFGKVLARLAQGERMQSGWWLISHRFFKNLTSPGKFAQGKCTSFSYKHSFVEVWVMRAKRRENVQ